MNKIPPQDQYYYEIAKNQGSKFYLSKSMSFIFADCNCEKYIMKCFDISCKSQSTQLTDGCVINNTNYQDL
jgi:hypothetical protein